MKLFIIEFHCFTVHFNSLNFIYQLMQFIYNKILVYNSLNDKHQPVHFTFNNIFV